MEQVSYLFSDIEGSTRLWSEHPESMGAVLSRHFELLSYAVESADGRVHKDTGDGILAVFPTARSAVAAAVAAQRAFVAEDWGPIGELRLRMGVNTGEVDRHTGDYQGQPVIRAARVMQVAHGGQVLVSEATYALVRHDPPDEIGFVDLGAHPLKGLDEPERIFQVTHPDLSDAFAAPRVSGRRGNLPAELSSFVGRDRELREVAELLATARLVTVTGAGGAGKTRLAARTASQRADRYHDGVWLIELAPLSDPGLIAAAAASTLGIAEAGERSPFDILVEHLSLRQALVIVDNCEHLLDTVAEFAEGVLHSCPQVRLLATSREPLGVSGEAVYPLGTLGVPDESDDAEAVLASEAGALFVERAVMGALAGPDEVRWVARICRRLDGLPLALELAAARTRALSVAQIAEHLDRRFDLLTGGPRTELPHHQTLRATIDWSHELLEPGEQALLRRLGVFPGTFSLEAAEVVCVWDPVTRPEALDLLAHLVDKSLVVREGGRYRLLETVRSYALERLHGAGDVERARRSHAEYFLALAEKCAGTVFGTISAEAAERLERDEDNLRAALEWSRHHDRSVLTRLAGALTDFWFRKGRSTEGRQWAEEALRDAEEPQDRATLLLGLTQLAWSQGDHESATRWGDEARSLYSELGDGLGEAIAIELLGRTAHGSGHMDEARELLERAREHFQAAGQHFWTGDSLQFLGLLARRRGDPERAADLHRQAADAFREADDDHGLAYALAALGLDLWDEGDLNAAHRLSVESLELFRALGDLRGVASGLVIAAELNLVMGQRVQAHALLSEALPQLVELRDRYMLALCLALTGRLSSEVERYSDAVLLWAAAHEMATGFRALIDGHAHDWYEPAVQTARAVLGDPDFEQLWTEGSNLRDTETVSLAEQVLNGPHRLTGGDAADASTATEPVAWSRPSHARQGPVPKR